MENATRLLTAHPYPILFMAVLAEQLGLPLPAVVFLAAGGAIAASGSASLGGLLCLAVAATLLADLIWFAAGWYRGRAVLDFIFRLSPGSDGYARRAWRSFSSRGDRVLLWAKFVPGLSTFTTPLAGAARMTLPRFLAFDGAGAVLWAGGYLAVGFLLGPELGRIAASVPELGGSRTLILLAAVLGAMTWKYVRARQTSGAITMVAVEAHDSRQG